MTTTKPKQELTKTEVSRRLALAIGYSADMVKVIVNTEGVGIVFVCNDESRLDGPLSWGGWQRFDHTDSEVFRHVAERYKCFPQRMMNLSTKKEVWVAQCDRASIVGAAHECPATASALAIIRHFESKA